MTTWEIDRIRYAVMSWGRVDAGGGPLSAHVLPHPGPLGLLAVVVRGCRSAVLEVVGPQPEEAVHEMLDFVASNIREDHR